jgi:peroxiredoxin Q/BCP
MPLEPGTPAPTVSALNQSGRERTPSFDDPTVVYFYPADNTPGCTTEATEFETERETYREAGVTVYGVSVDDVDSHAAFAEQHDIAFDLLADPEGDIAAAFDVKQRASGMTERRLIDRLGIVASAGIRRAFGRADRLGMALRARCFAWNPTLPALRLSVWDLPALVLAAGLVGWALV